MLSHVYHWIIYFIIPGIMIAILVVGIYLSQRVPNRYRLSARAGLGAGVLAFIIYVAASFRNLQAVPPNASTLPVFHWAPMIIGLVLGFAILLLMQLLRLTPALVGLFFLFLVATSSTAALSWFFVSSTRDFTIFFALSALLGTLLYIIFFSEKDVVRELLGRERQRWD
jgi:hypothetical protein